MTKKKKVICKECGEKFNDNWYKNYHIRKTHKIHTNFLSLVNNYQNWGKTHSSIKESKEYQDSPPDNDLILGYLRLLVIELRNIKEEISRERLIK